MSWQLLEEMDNLIDQAKKNLFQFEVETHSHPCRFDLLNFIRLTQHRFGPPNPPSPALSPTFNGGSTTGREDSPGSTSTEKENDTAG